MTVTTAADEAPALDPIPDLPAPARRKRLLSEEERALWECVAGQTKPLRKKSRAREAAAGFGASRAFGRQDRRAAKAASLRENGATAKA